MRFKPREAVLPQVCGKLVSKCAKLVEKSVDPHEIETTSLQDSYVCQRVNYLMTLPLTTQGRDITISKVNRWTAAEQQLLKQQVLTLWFMTPRVN